MIGNSPFSLIRSLALAIPVVLALGFGAVLAAEPPAAGAVALLAKYPSIKAKLEKNQFGAPVYLESVEGDDSLQVDMYGTFEEPFDTVKEALQSPANWCDIASLHVNIKACAWRKNGGQPLLTIYSGRKYYQSPADAYPLKFRFRRQSLQPAYLSLALAADTGPLGTREHRIVLEAVPLSPGRTLVHFSYGYRYGPVARLAIKTYFATIARDKVGFSVEPGAGGKYFYRGGVRGSLERNTVRYFLALQTYLEALRFPEGARFEWRIGRWYDLTARYPRQLQEMEKEEYLVEKRREHLNQLLLQQP